MENQSGTSFMNPSCGTAQLNSRRTMDPMIRLTKKHLLVNISLRVMSQNKELSNSSSKAIGEKISKPR